MGAHGSDVDELYCAPDHCHRKTLDGRDLHDARQWRCFPRCPVLAPGAHEPTAWGENASACRQVARGGCANHHGSGLSLPMYVYILIAGGALVVVCACVHCLVQRSRRHRSQSALEEHERRLRGEREVNLELERSFPDPLLPIRQRIWSLRPFSQGRTSKRGSGDTSYDSSSAPQIEAPRSRAESWPASQGHNSKRGSGSGDSSCDSSGAPQIGAPPAQVKRLDMIPPASTVQEVLLRSRLRLDTLLLSTCQAAPAQAAAQAVSQPAARHQCLDHYHRGFS